MASEAAVPSRRRGQQLALSISLLVAAALGLPMGEGGTLRTILQGAAIQWVLVCACYGLIRRFRTAGLIVGFLIGAVELILMFDRMSAPAIRVQIPVLFFVALVCFWANWSLLRFASASLAASLLSLALMIVPVGMAEQRHYAALVDQFPFKSLDDRLAYEAYHSLRSSYDGGLDQSTAPGAPPTMPSAEALAELDERFDFLDWRGRRAESLRLVHASRVEQFISAEGFFGASRMLRPSARAAEYDDTDPPAVPKVLLPRYVAGFAGEREPGWATSSLPLPMAEWAGKYHTDAIYYFINRDGFGYVVDREHVVGFRSHRFHRAPDVTNWQTLRIELVSLLKHDEPMVYISESLPSMEDLRHEDVPVRPLDDFEGHSLAKLWRGAEFETEESGQLVRMFGAIRAAKQCLVCHAVEHGTLLGAFSYELVPAPAFLSDLTVEQLRDRPGTEFFGPTTAQ